MRLRHAWVVCWLACLGCHSLVALRLDQEPDPSESLWDQGQAAMRDGRPDDAVALYEQSLAANPGQTRNHLSLAAAHLDAGNKAAACTHLAQYLAHHPDQFAVRAHYAELLLRLERRGDARGEFERFIADAQDATEDQGSRLIHAHGRLMELADEAEDAYGRNLHRGIGLYHLACCRAELDDGEDTSEVLPSDGLLWKAAETLLRAHEMRPDEARPCWYLHNVWRRLGQPQQAARWLRETASALPFTSLTPAEQRSLQLALGTLDLAVR